MEHARILSNTVVYGLDTNTAGDLEYIIDDGPFRVQQDVVCAMLFRYLRLHSRGCCPNDIRAEQLPDLQTVCKSSA